MKSIKISDENKKLLKTLIFFNDEVTTYDNAIARLIKDSGLKEHLERLSRSID